MRRLALFAVMLVVIEATRAAAPEYGYQVVHVYPHDRNAFTQGLEYRGGFCTKGPGLRAGRHYER